MEDNSICGISGIIGDLNKGGVNLKKDFLLECMWAGTFRGADSTGVAYIPKDKKEEPEIYKRAVNGADFTQLKRTRDLVEKAYYASAYIIHNRSATRGTLSDINAHPFRHGHITLVHNGTINNHHSLTKSTHQVDSHAVCEAIAIDGADAVLPKLMGGFSLVWHDEKDGSINFARNSDRPMWWLWLKDKSSLMFASEYQMLWWLANRHGMDVEGKAFYTAPMAHYKIADPTKPEVFVKTPFTQAPAITYPQRGGSTWDPTRNRSYHYMNNDGENTDATVMIPFPILTRLLKHINRARAIDLLRLARLNQISLDSGMMVTAHHWRPYKGGQQGKGVIVCKTKNDKDVLLHSFTQAQWHKLAKPKDRQIHVEIINFEGTVGSNNIKFVGLLNDEDPKIIIPSKEDAAAVMAAKIVDARKQNMEAANDTTVESPLFLGPKGHFWSFQKFIDKTRQGCANCSHTPDTKEAPDLHWINDNDDFLCKGCWDDEEVRNHFKEFIPTQLH